MSTRAPSPALVEPLTQQAWQRVEAALFARLDAGVLLALLALRARLGANQN